MVENKPGAAGNLGAEQVFNADPDGYTLMVTAPSPLTVNQSLYAKLAFDPAAFVPVTIMATIPTGLFVSPNKIKANTVAEFIAYAKENPGKVTAATQGNGSTSHLTSEWFQMAAGVTFVQVPYRGSAPALQGMVAGDVDLFFDNLGVSLNLAKEGKRSCSRSAPSAHGIAASHAGARRVIARLRVIELGRRVPAAEDAAGDRRQAQRGFCRNAEGPRHRRQVP